MQQATYQATYFVKTNHNTLAVNNLDDVAELLIMMARTADFMLEDGQVLTIELKKTTIDDRIVLAPDELNDVVCRKLYGYAIHFTAVDFSTATTTLSESRGADF